MDVDAAEIEEAVAFAAFDNLKKREREGYFQSARLRPGKKDIEDSYKVRRGISGSYRRELEPEEVERIDAFIANTLDPAFGY